MTFHPQISWNKLKNCKNTDEAKFFAFFFPFINKIHLMSSIIKKTTLSGPMLLKTVNSVVWFQDHSNAIQDASGHVRINII